jgi:hypothetical protein
VKIATETLLMATPDRVWGAWNTPADIMPSNAAHESWQPTRVEGRHAQLDAAIADVPAELRTHAGPVTVPASGQR